MNTTYREFDTDSPSTPPSRSVRIARNSSRGFTLIELLVVISIIALLSTIVLAAIGDSRTKARNVAKNSLVLEYLKALELYRGDHSAYPPTTAIPVCFGYAGGENCYFGLRVGSSTITDSLGNYMADDYAHRQPVPSALGDGNGKGVLYSCNSASTCNAYTFVWILEKGVTSCIKGSTETDIFDGVNTHCLYTPN